MPTGLTPALVTKHLPRRSTLVRKRDGDEIPQPSSPSKRSKVSFDSDVEVRIVEEWEKSPAVIQDSVRRAIQKHVAGDGASYERIKLIYAPTKGDQDMATPTTVKNYTVALLSNVSLLDKKCADLVHAVLDSDWLGRSADYVQLFTQFLANLVSAQGLFLPNVLRMLADNLTSTPPLHSSMNDCLSIPRSQIYARAHKTLQYLLQIIPSACCLFLSILTKIFPHQSDSRRAHLVYVHNLLQITGYAPILQTDILALITERLVKIDLQVQEDLEDLAEDAEEGLVQHESRSLDDVDRILDDSEDSDEESDTDEEADQELLRTREITKNVEKMDYMLDMLFAYHDHQFASPSASIRAGSLDILL
ncbi:MAG: hypothetical protein Q9184_008240, partial [Pyrenodesmia sp. 2 TL-2023]